MADLLRIVDRADSVIAVDSGVLAISLALGKPTVALFGPTSHEIIADQFERYVPMRCEVIHDTMRGGCERACNFMKTVTPYGTKCEQPPVAKCMAAVQPEEVVAALNRIVQ